MDPQIVLRKITAATADFFSLCQRAGHRFDAGADSQAMLLGTGQLDRDPMIFRGRRAAQNHGSAIQVFYNHIDPAVVEKISEGGTAGDSGLGQSSSALLAGVAKGAIVAIHE